MKRWRNFSKFINCFYDLNFDPGKELCGNVGEKGAQIWDVNAVKTLLKDSKLSCVIFEKLDYHLPDDLFPLLMISRYNFTIWILYNPCWLIFEMWGPGWTQTTWTIMRKEQRSKLVDESQRRIRHCQCSLITSWSSSLLVLNLKADWVKSAPQWFRDTNGFSYLWRIFIEFRDRRVIWLKRTKQQEMRLVDPPLWPNPQSVPEIRWWKKENTKFAGEGNV